MTFAKKLFLISLQNEIKRAESVGLLNKNLQKNNGNLQAGTKRLTRKIFLLYIQYEPLV